MARDSISDREPCALKDASTVRRGEQRISQKESALLPYSFSGEVKLARKHTRFINRDLPRLVQSAVGKLMDRWHHQDTRLANYKLADLDDRTAHDLVIRSCDVGVVPNRTIPDVLREWREPRHEEFEPRNIWSLFNAFTEALKGNLIELPRRTEALHGLLDNHVGLALPS